MKQKQVNIAPKNGKQTNLKRPAPPKKVAAPVKNDEEKAVVAVKKPANKKPAPVQKKVLPPKKVATPVQEEEEAEEVVEKKVIPVKKPANKKAAPVPKKVVEVVEEPEEEEDDEEEVEENDEVEDEEEMEADEEQEDEEVEAMEEGNFCASHICKFCDSLIESRIAARLWRLFKTFDFTIYVDGDEQEDDDEEDDDEEAEVEQEENEEDDEDDGPTEAPIDEEPTIPSKVKTGQIPATVPFNKIVHITKLPKSKLSIQIALKNAVACMFNGN